MSRSRAAVMNLATDRREQNAPPRPTTRLGGTDVFRGALVIITALIIGGIVIGRGLDRSDNAEAVSQDEASADVADPAAPADAADQADEADEANGGQETTVTTAAAITPSTVATTEVPVEQTVPTVPELRNPAEVTVLVLNGAQTQGIAARGTEILKAASYTTGAPKNADQGGPSAVLYAEGFEREAVEVAATFSAGLEAIVAPLDPANLPIQDTQNADVIVIIGNDNLIPVP